MSKYDIKKHKTGPEMSIGNKYAEVYAAIKELNFGEWISIENIERHEADKMRVTLWQQINARRDYRIATRIVTNGKEGVCTLWIRKLSKQVQP